MPRPSDGFVHAQASPRLSTPSAGPAPLPFRDRTRSTTPPIGMTGVVGSPSSQCAWRGHARTSAVQRAGSRSALSGWSREEP